jgi:hypothetical protein
MLRYTASRACSIQIKTMSATKGEDSKKGSANGKWLDERKGRRRGRRGELVK